jgi:hypothetical protein
MRAGRRDVQMLLDLAQALLELREEHTVADGAGLEWYSITARRSVAI